VAKPIECAEYLKQGLYIDDIAGKLGISVGSVVNYLQTAVGKGIIRRSDIYFGIDPEYRSILGQLVSLRKITKAYDLIKACRRLDIPIDDVIVDNYFVFRDARVAKGDMYEFIAEIETNLHKTIKDVLINSYGENENEWWRQGIPTEIRQECHRIREADPEPSTEAFSYTTFIQLSKIIDKQWMVFSGVLPDQVVENKKILLEDLNKLNRIRNGVMHPVKGIELTEEDFELVRKYRNVLQPSHWNFI
jgi:DNA-binding Lrp family transcriptional regulator